MHWERSSPELTSRFERVTDGVDGIARKKMFGEIAGFVNGNLVTGLHAGRWFVRLTGDERLPRSPCRGPDRSSRCRAARWATTSSCRRTWSTTTRRSCRGSTEPSRWAKPSSRSKRRPALRLPEAHAGVRSSMPHGDP